MLTVFSGRDSMQLRLLRGLVFCVFLGRAWQHLFWDAPLRELLWRESIMAPLVGFFGISWQDWVGNLAVDDGIQLTIRLMGAVYAVCALFALTVQLKSRIQQGVLLLGTALLCFLAFLYYLEQFYRVGQFIEYALQVGSPLFLLAALRGKLQEKRWQWALKLAVALTFLGHGLYAAGYYPMPGPFVSMVMNGFGLAEDAARNLLRVAGYLDFALVIALFIPRVSRIALAYAVLWGFATAFARVLASAETPTLLDWVITWWFECLIRLVHGGIPLLMLWQSAARPAVVAPTLGQALQA